MKNKTIYIIKGLVYGLLLFSVLSCNKQENKNFSKTVKVALREVGHQLLFANADSTSLVQPIIALDKHKFVLSFQSSLTIQPDSLVHHIQSSFNKAGLPQQYITEVTRCDDQEVAYSYAMKQDIEKGIIPCSGRKLNTGCYEVTVHFTALANQNKNHTKLLYILFLGLLVLLVLFAFKRKSKQKSQPKLSDYTAIGRFQFYPEQNKLIKEAIEIPLSKKECEILALFVAQPNQIIKREALIKKVWEDNGVVVGRSLDTYISKLRKKLQEDDTIKLTNIHGVGYKLEVLSL